jgi:hypothetical protein
MIANDKGLAVNTVSGTHKIAEYRLSIGQP